MFKSFFSSSRSKRVAANGKRKGRAAIPKLDVELLEDRAVPAVLIVAGSASITMNEGLAISLAEFDAYFNASTTRADTLSLGAPGNTSFTETPADPSTGTIALVDPIRPDGVTPLNDSGGTTPGTPGVSRTRQATTLQIENLGDVLGSWSTSNDNFGAFVGDSTVGEQIAFTNMQRWTNPYTGSLVFGDFALRYTGSRLALTSNLDFLGADFADIGNTNISVSGNTLTIQGDLLIGGGLAALDPSAIQGTEFGDITITATLSSDFGDAPDSYGTLLASNGPRHVATGPILGTLRDSELNGLPSVNANGDNVSSLNDDDGVAFNTLYLGQISSTVGTIVTVSNAPSGAKLDAWMDFNGNGVFDSPSEQIAAGVTVVNGANNITFAIPANATTSTTYARFRLSTTGGLSPTGAASDGEVEDYAVTIQRAKIVAGSAWITMNEGLAASISEFDAYFNASTTRANSLALPAPGNEPFTETPADPSTGAISLVDPIRPIGVAPLNDAGGTTAGTPGQSRTRQATTLQIDNLSNLLGSWSTSNDNFGIFVGDSVRGEQIALTDMQRWTGPFTGVLVYGDFALRYTGSRLALTSNIDFLGADFAEIGNPVITVSGDTLAIQGDLLMGGGLAVLDPSAVPGTNFGTITITAILSADFGDAPDSYGTLLASDGARHAMTGPILGTLRDSEADGLPTVNADGDNTTNLNDDDGVTFNTLFRSQNSSTVGAVVTVSNAPSGAKLDAWLDFNGNGVFDSPTEQIASGVSVVNGANNIAFAIPSNATTSTTYARFRLSTAGGLSSIGAASDGEVEDFAVTIQLPPAPTVASVAPFVGPTSGGNTVVITGTNFDTIDPDHLASAVKFGAANATNYTVNSASQITAIAPAGAAATINVVVTNPGGSSANDATNGTTGTTSNDYTYAIKVASVVPGGVAVHTLEGATWSSGNSLVTVASTAGLAVGAQVSSFGAGFPVRATVLSIDSGTTFTLSSAPTAAPSTPTTVKFANAPEKSGTVLQLASATWANGSTNVTVADTTGLFAGQYVGSTAPGLPADVVVASVTDGTTFVLSSPATADATGATIDVAIAAIARDRFGSLVDLSGPNAGSIVQHLVVTFYQKVTLDPGAFSIANLGSSVTTNSVAPATGDVAVVAAGIPGTGDEETGFTQYVLNFVPGSATNSYTNSAALGNAFTTLKNSVFRLDTDGSKVRAGADVGVSDSKAFWSLYGVVNAGDIFVTGAPGAADNSVTPPSSAFDQLKVDGLALNDTYSTFGSFSNATTPPYNRSFDQDLDGDVDGIDLHQLYANFGTIWTF